MRKGVGFPQRPLAAHQEPLEDRVDKAGKRQLKDPVSARASRDAARREAADAEGDPVGWWYFDGLEWSYRGKAPR